MSSSYGRIEPALAKPSVLRVELLDCPQSAGAPVVRRRFEARYWKRSVLSLIAKSLRYGDISFDVPTIAERTSRIITEQARNVSTEDDGTAAFSYIAEPIAYKPASRF